MFFYILLPTEQANYLAYERGWLWGQETTSNKRGGQVLLVSYKEKGDVFRRRPLSTSFTQVALIYFPSHHNETGMLTHAK